MTTSTTSSEVRSGEGGEEENEQDLLSNASDNESDNNDSVNTEKQETKLSKRQLRKIKKKENALKYRAEKRLRERENKKRRKREMREKGEDLGPSKKQLKRNTMANSSCKVKVVIDCSFDHLMSEKDIMKLTQQLGYSYSANRRASDPLQFYVTSLGGKTKERMDRVGDYPSWDVNFTEKDYLSTFDKDSVVYLSSESDNVLTTLDPDKAYIIGGLVDHNHHKDLCHKLAVEKGINHAQLPIGKYLEMKSRIVLTINHVFEILLRFTESNDWEEAFFQVLPKRKGATSKPSKHKASPGNSDDDVRDDKNCDKPVCDRKDTQGEEEPNRENLAGDSSSSAANSDNNIEHAQCEKNNSDTRTSPDSKNKRSITEEVENKTS